MCKDFVNFVVSMSENQRILLLGDYSNCHRSLAAGLRALGCDVTVASDGSRWMNCERDIDICRHGDSKLAGLRYWFDIKRLMSSRLRGFDIVAVNDPVFFQLHPRRLRPLFERLKSQNGSVFLTSMSTDLAYLDMVSAPDCPLRYSEWFIDGAPSRYHESEKEQWRGWHNPVLTDYQDYFFDNIDGAVSVLYEYQLGMERRLGRQKAAYSGLPIQTELFEPVDLAERPEKVKFFLGRDRYRKLMKGSDYLEEAARRVVERNPGRAELIIVENRPYAEFIELLKSADVVLDQIYSYTPATTALMAMAYGKPVVTGGEPEFYDFIGEHENRPIINAPIDLEALTQVLEGVVNHPESLRLLGRRSREFVVKHNDSRVVARRFLDFWNERRAAKS